MITAFATALTLIASLPQSPAEVVSIHGPQPALVKLGETTRMTIVVTGASGNPRDFRIPKTATATFGLRSGGVESGRSYRNGRSHVWQKQTIFLDIKPRRLGKITFPAFTFNSGTKQFTVPAKIIEVVRDMTAAERASFKVLPSVDSVYVNEPIRFEVEVAIDERMTIVEGRVQSGIPCMDLSVQAPWLEEMDGAVKMADRELSDSINILLNGRAPPQAVKYDVVERNGVRYNRYSFERAFLPTRAGRIELAAPSVEFTVYGARSGGRGVFGEALRARNKSYSLVGEPIVIEVKSLPVEGRPASYSNGVGRFTLRAAVNKKTVKVGNSIQLTLTIAGKGNLEFVDLPALEGMAGFHQLGKKIHRDPEAVRITYDLTPLDETVTEVPAFAWSFFDTRPGIERYVELATDPIPIRVEALAEGGGLSTLRGEDAGSVVAGVDDIFDMKPIDADRVALPARPGVGFSAAMLLAPWFVCLAVSGLLRSRRRRSQDVLGQRAKGAAKNFERVYAEKGDATEALVAYLSDRLGMPAAAVIASDLGKRLVEAGIDEDLAAELQAAIDAGTASRYGGAGALNKADATGLMKRMHSVQIDMKKIARGIVGVLVLMTTASGVIAQGETSRMPEPASAPSVEEAVQAYRAGEYEKAAQGFRAASEEPDADRRLFYNLGNSLFRQDRFGDALVAYRQARLGMPRDAELARNIVLVRKKLDLGTAEGESFLTSLLRLRDQVTGAELFWLCLVCHLFAAVSLVFGRRVWRVLGFVVLAHALLFTVELLVLGPARPEVAIVTTDRAEVTAEPRAGLEAVLKLRQGVAVAVLGETPDWTRVLVEGREGYLPTAALGFVR